jgi:hypothetical protein
MHCRFGPRNGVVFTISPVNDTNLTPSNKSNDDAQTKFPAEPPQGKLAPSGGSAGREAPSVGAPFMKTIKSFVRRAGRITTGQSKAFEDLGDKYLLNSYASKNAINLIATKQTNMPHEHPHAPCGAMRVRRWYSQEFVAILPLTHQSYSRIYRHRKSRSFVILSPLF